eukprot:EG_transcript_27081
MNADNAIAFLVEAVIAMHVPSPTGFFLKTERGKILPPSRSAVAGGGSGFEVHSAAYHTTHFQVTFGWAGPNWAGVDKRGKGTRPGVVKRKPIPNAHIFLHCAHGYLGSTD